MYNERIIKLQHFFSADVKIKKEMNEISPHLNQYLDENSMIKYTDKVNDSLNYIFSELKCITLDIFGVQSNVFERICYLEQITKNSFYSCGLDIDKLKIFYKKFIANLELNFINSVKNECVGYNVFVVQNRRIWQPQ